MYLIIGITLIYIKKNETGNYVVFLVFICKLAVKKYSHFTNM